MKVVIPFYNEIRKVVSIFSQQLKIDKLTNKTGRKLALPIITVLSLAIFKQAGGIATKKSLFTIFNLHKICSYKTLVMSINRWAILALRLMFIIMRMSRKNQHIIKHIDSTDIPVCLFKNANKNKVMKMFASFGRSAKGTYFGLKMHLIADFKRQILAIKFTSANVDDRDVVIKLSKKLNGVFIADAGYVSEKLQRKFHRARKRILLVKARNNMKKVITQFQKKLYDTRMIIELNFRNLKMFYGLITSLPKSVDGYLSNYIYSLLAYQII
jgi:transposase